MENPSASPPAAVFSPKVMRRLIAAVAFMGILIIAGTGFLAVTVFQRFSHRTADISGPDFPRGVLTLPLEKGERVQSVTQAGKNLLAVQLAGPDSQRILIWNPGRQTIVRELRFSARGLLPGQLP